jgi:hypothetical protein
MGLLEPHERYGGLFRETDWVNYIPPLLGEGDCFARGSRVSQCAGDGFVDICQWQACRKHQGPETGGNVDCGIVSPDIFYPKMTRIIADASEARALVGQLDSRHPPKHRHGPRKLIIH